MSVIHAIYRLRGKSLEQLTEDHRIRVSEDTTYLSRALGMDAQLEIDYQAVPVERGDVFFLVTDGVTSIPP
jgi:serine/threonine protein phosphatase PrpC